MPSSKSTSISSIPSSPLLPMAMLALALCTLSTPTQAYPAFFMQPILPQRHSGSRAMLAHVQPAHAAQKRAFDRLDVSPFDFDAMTKRFTDDELSALPYDDVYAFPALEVPRKRAFDRLEDSAFFGLKKRAFDRLDNSFMMLMKRRGEEA